MTGNWRDLVAPDDYQALRGGGYGGKVELGTAPCLLVVDATHNFAGRMELSAEENARRYPKAAPEPAAQAVSCIVELVQTFKRMGRPVVMTTNRGRHGAVESGLWSTVTNVAEADDGEEVIEPVRAVGYGMELRKSKPSAFFATPLVSWLHAMAVDSVVLVGGTTSGCVRATVVDAFSYNYPTWVVEEGVFDRSLGSHVTSLFDMSMKYADVVSLEAALAALSRLDTSSGQV